MTCCSAFRVCAMRCYVWVCGRLMCDVWLVCAMLLQREQLVPLQAQALALQVDAASPVLVAIQDALQVLEAREALHEAVQQGLGRQLQQQLLLIAGSTSRGERAEERAEE